MPAPLFGGKNQNLRIYFCNLTKSNLGRSDKPDEMRRLPATCPRNPNRGERGFVLILTAVAITLICAGLALAIDITRIYITKSELQAFADLAATAAAYELDGTTSGIATARSVAQSGFAASRPVARWNFGSTLVSQPTVEFSKTFNGTYTANPVSAPDYLFVRVTVTQASPILFATILPGVASNITITAAATSGQAVQTSLGDGLAPFSPDAHNPADRNFGFVRGLQYTLRWPPPGKRNSLCTGDVGFPPAGGSGDRGYIDVGQGTGNSAIVGAVVNNDFFLPLPMTIGTVLSTLTGGKSVTDAVQQRLLQDTDTTSTTYSQYTGNGRRVVTVAVNAHDDPGTVTGFGAFLLPPNPCGLKNTDPCCGEYIGAALEFADHPGASSGGGLFAVKLFQ
jgi:Flp pilus assembly protein TadG